MKVAILGSRAVGQALCAGFHKAGHEVTMGTRDPSTERIREWVSASPGNEAATLGNAAEWCELAVLCTGWSGTENAIALAGADNLAGKVVIDVTNPLSGTDSGMGLALGHTDSGGEQVQRWLPHSSVVKSLNVLNANFMCNPAGFGPDAEMWVAGNDAAAKETVSAILTSFGWNVVDLGGIDKARLLESLAMLWITRGVINQKWDFHFVAVTSS